MTLAASQITPVLEGRRWTFGTRTGARTAANFTITLGFRPTHIRVVNLTDRISALHIVDSALDAGDNAKSLLGAAVGTVTYAAAGIAVSANGRSFTVTVATASLETDNDDVYWEAWA